MGNSLSLREKNRFVDFVNKNSRYFDKKLRPIDLSETLFYYESEGQISGELTPIRFAEKTSPKTFKNFISILRIGCFKVFGEWRVDFSPFISLAEENKLMETDFFRICEIKAQYSRETKKYLKKQFRKDKLVNFCNPPWWWCCGSSTKLKDDDSQFSQIIKFFLLLIYASRQLPVEFEVISKSENLIGILKIYMSWQVTDTDSNGIFFHTLKKLVKVNPSILHSIKFAWNINHFYTIHSRKTLRDVLFIASHQEISEKFYNSLSQSLKNHELEIKANILIKFFGKNDSYVEEFLKFYVNDDPSDQKIKNLKYALELFEKYMRKLDVAKATIILSKNIFDPIFEDTMLANQCEDELKNIVDYQLTAKSNSIDFLDKYFSWVTSTPNYDNCFDVIYSLLLYYLKRVGNKNSLEKLIYNYIMEFIPVSEKYLRDNMDLIKYAIWLIPSLQNEIKIKNEIISNSDGKANIDEPFLKVLSSHKDWISCPLTISNNCIKENISLYVTFLKEEKKDILKFENLKNTIEENYNEIANNFSHNRMSYRESQRAENMMKMLISLFIDKGLKKLQKNLENKIFSISF